MEPRETLPLLGFRRRKLKDTQTKSRIGYKCGMRSRLGEANWAAFVRYADAEYKADFFLALTPPTAVLCCEGRLNGAPCPKQVQIDLLFGTRDHLLLQCSDRPLWQRQIFFRCGTVRSVDGQKAEDFCHDVDSAHYEHTLNVKSIKWQTSPAPEK